MELNCSALEKLVNFKSYISALRNVTNDYLSAGYMEPCRHEICAALYGTSSSDVSGIGVLFGYVTDFGIAIALAITLLSQVRRQRPNLLASCRKITGVYIDSAITLALSVEIASATMLIRKNFGLGTIEFGGLTVQIVWVVSTLVMLPVVSLCWRDLKDERLVLRLSLTALAFVSFLITFISKMVNTYSNQQIGSDADAVVSNEEAGQLDFLCFKGTPNLSPLGPGVARGFSIGAFIWILCNTILALIDQCLDDSKYPRIASELRYYTRPLKDDTLGTIISSLMLAFWGVPLFATLITLRSWQNTLAESIGEASGSDAWTFGQIISVIVFLPVLTEVVHECVEHRHSSKVGDGQGTNLWYGSRRRARLN